MSNPQLRVVVAMMQHETNTFSPVPTPLERFGSDGVGVPTGQLVYDTYRGTGTGIGAFIEVAEAAGMEIITPVAGNAAPSGRVQRDAYGVMADAICEAIEAGCDACFLDLHGAMVTEDTEDGEGALLSRIRTMAPDLPIAVSLDLHANITDAMVDNCSVIVGYKTYPHIDMYEAGRHAGQILVRMLAGEVDPVMSWGNRPLLAQTLRMGHEDAPMGPLIDIARSQEADGLLAATVFGGFPLADVHEAGLSVVTVADRDQDLANTTRDTLLDAAWDARHDFIFDSRPIDDVLAEVTQLEDGPIILLDHADNSASGGTQDTMAALEAVMKAGLEDVAMFAICDPEAVEQMTTAGVGNEVTLRLGGKTDMPTIDLRGEPLDVTGTVRSLTDGRFQITAAMGRGTWAAMGPSGLLDLGNVKVAVISRHTEPFDLGHLRSLGVEPTSCRYIILKSRIHYRAGFRAIAAHEIPITGVGVTSSDNSLFDFKSVRRPVFPLDMQ